MLSVWPMLTLTPVWSLAPLADGRLPLPALSLAAATAWAPLALAFGAGVLAVFNPCGFALLPAFVSYTVGGQLASRGGPREQEQAPVAARLLRGLGLGLPLTAGFLIVFLVAGSVLAAGGRALAQVFPWLGLVVGLALIGLSVRLLLSGTTIEMPVLARVASAISGRRGSPSSAAAAACCDAGVEMPRGSGAAASVPLRSAWAFGLGYGVSSLGCTLPIFLLVVGSAVAAGGLWQAVLVFAAYAMGMAVMLLGTALVATSLGDVLRQSVLPLLRWAQPLAAVFILAAGVYIVVYQLRAGVLIH